MNNQACIYQQYLFPLASNQQLVQETTLDIDASLVCELGLQRGEGFLPIINTWLL